MRYFCTTRDGGSSQRPFNTLNLATHVGDALPLVQANRRTLASAVGRMPVWLEQVHGTGVYDADLDLCHSDSVQQLPIVADASVTSVPGRVLAILTADCLPVVIADDEGRAVGVAHAGWRGLAAGVLETTLKTLKHRLPPGAVLRAWIGPAISQSVFEVGEDVYTAFCDADPDTKAWFVARVPCGASVAPKWLADLPGLARHRLLRAGVSYVECSGWCTVRNPDLFFSYRAQGRTGRMATVAWIDQTPELP